MTIKDRQEQIRLKLNQARKTISDGIGGAVERVAIGESIERQVDNIQKGIEKNIQAVLQGLDIVTKKDLDKLEKKVEALGEQVAKLQDSIKESKKATPKKSAAKKSTSKKSAVKKTAPKKK